MLNRTLAHDLDFLFPAGDSVIGPSLATYGEFSQPLLDFLLEHASEESGTLLDVGANIGSVGLPFAAARRSWKVKAIEAHRGLATILSANAINNRLTNVEVIQAAAGEATGVAQFPSLALTERGNWGVLSLSSPTTDTVSTLMLTLDEIAPVGTRLVKIDVEGNEPPVLRGARRLLEEIRPVWVVEAATNHPGAAREAIEILLGAGYAVYWFFVTFAGGKTRKGQPSPTPGKGDVNVVALPPGRPNSWNLTQVTSLNPPGPAGYPYLRRYGVG